VSLEDLPPEKQRQYLERLASLTPAQRFAMALDVIDRSRAFMEAGIRLRFPNATHRQVQAQVAAMLCGPEVARRLYGSFPEEEQ
jgi:hypothetical protein